MSSGEQAFVAFSMGIAVLFGAPLLWMFIRNGAESASEPRDSKLDLTQYVHIIIFSNQKVANKATYKVVCEGGDITAQFGVLNRNGVIERTHIDWEGKWELGGEIRSKLGKEPVFWHRVNLDGDEAHTSRGYGQIRTHWHSHSPRNIYEELLRASKPIG
jgi:hypothetical protein